MVRLMLVLGLVLSLAACGGSRTDGLSKSDEEALEARLEAAEAERAAAEADKVAAEADKVAAEADKVAAEAAQAAAEAAQAAAEADKAIAEADKVAAEAAQAAAEAAQAAAEADKAIAEADKAIAEADKVAAEAAQAAAEADKAIAETAKAAAEADKAVAETAKAVAETAKAVAEADKAIAEAEVQHQLREAEAARQEAETARQEAETARLEAETARGEADTARGEADTARGETEAAEREQERLAEEAEEARQQVLAAEAIDAYEGLETASTDAVTVTPKRRAAALVELGDATFTSSTTGSSVGRWYATRAHKRGATNEDTILVYSDKGTPESVPIMDRYGNFGAVTDTSLLEIGIVNNDHKDLIASSRFPTGGRTTYISRTIDNTPDDNNEDKNLAKFRGTFDGASGDFLCSSTAAADQDVCSVEHTGAGYELADGNWTFRTSKNSTVKVPDANFMHFGWWRRQNIATGAFFYQAFRSVTGAEASDNPTEFNALEGSANYEGPALGQYAISQALGTQSNHGEFNATARFTANFDTEMLSGTVSGFDVNPGWSLTLKATAMTGGTATGAPDSVSWTIDGKTEDGGMWEGIFQSEDTYDGQIPDGVTGVFNAEYNDVGRLRGAYGATVK